MQWKRLRAVISKEIKHARSDLSFLLLSVVAPALLLLLLGNVFSFEVSRIDLMVINRDQSPLATEYLRYLAADGTIQMAGEAANDQDAIEHFRSGEADAALVIPPGFGAGLQAGREVPISLLVDGSDAGMGQSVVHEVESRSTRFSSEVIGTTSTPFTINPRFFFNPNLDNYASMIPGLLPMVLIPSIMAVALSITREMETGTFEMLITSPVLGSEFLIGKLIVHLGMGLTGAYLALAIAIGWFDIPFRGGIALFGLAALVYLFAMMSICILLTHYIRNQRAVTTVILMLFFVPSFFLTDFLAPVDPGSGVSYLVSRVLPSAYFVTMARGISLKGVALGDISGELITLTAIGCLALIASLATFRKKLA